MLLWRLNLSPYQQANFSIAEEKLAQKHGLAYACGTQLSDTSQDSLILITNTHTLVQELSSDLLKRVTLLIHPNSGFDHFSFDWVKQASFPIILGNTIRSHAVSNSILSHMLNHYSPLQHQSEWDQTRTYERKVLNELNVLLIGHGHIGKILEKALSPLVKKIHISDPHHGKKADELKADVIIPIASLNKSTRHLIDSDFLREQPQDFCLINCARGPIVKMDDLVSTLEKRPLATAYLDVFEKEPANFSHYAHLNNLKTTSHIAGVYKNIDQKTLSFEDQIITDFLKLDIESFQNNYENELLQHQPQENFL
jgi:D-3-phosphoglycerate dehydrogenase